MTLQRNDPGHGKGIALITVKYFGYDFGHLSYHIASLNMFNTSAVQFAI